MAMQINNGAGPIASAAALGLVRLAPAAAASCGGDRRHRQRLHHPGGGGSSPKC